MIRVAKGQAAGGFELQKTGSRRGSRQTKTGWEMYDQGRLVNKPGS